MYLFKKAYKIMLYQYNAIFREIIKISEIKNIF